MEIVHAHVFHVEQDRAACGETGGDQVLHDLVLAVDGHAFPARQLGEIDAVTLAPEAQLDAVMDQSFALHARADAGLDEEVDRALLQHAGADALLDIGAAAVLEDHRIDPLEMEEMGQEQAGRPGSDDPHLRAHRQRCRLTVRASVASERSKNTVSFLP